MQEGTPIIIKRKKAHHAAHHGGAWKVAYADFVTAMMAFFMVMWIMSLNQNDRQLVQAYFEDPVGFSKNYPKNDAHVLPFKPSSKMLDQKNEGNAEIHKDVQAKEDMQKVREQVLEEIKQDPKLKELLEQKSIETIFTERGLEIELIESDMNGEVFFKVGSAIVQPKAVEVMSKIAPVLARTNHPLVFEGHTDSRPFQNPNYDNFDLSHDRANSVRHLMEQFGVPVSQVASVEGYADTRPRIATDPSHFSNRRVTILLPYAVQKSRSITELPTKDLKESTEGVFWNPTGR